jgi:hypothetical protein
MSNSTCLSKRDFLLLPCWVSTFLLYAPSYESIVVILSLMCMVPRFYWFIHDYGMTCLKLLVSSHPWTLKVSNHLCFAFNMDKLNTTLCFFYALDNHFTFHALYMLSFVWFTFHDSSMVSKFIAILYLPCWCYYDPSSMCFYNCMIMVVW